MSQLGVLCPRGVNVKIEWEGDRKRCTLCREFKPVTEYYRRASGEEGYRARCKSCKRLEEQGRWEDIAEYKRQWAVKNPHKRRAYKVLNRYGITLAQYNAMYEQQDGQCAICRRSEVEHYRKLSIDHDHETGIVRGLLCGTCNSAIGMLDDNPDLLRAAATYIEEARQCKSA